jgi:superfamily II DNA/RNA helicase
MGEEVPQPIQSFYESGLRPFLLENVKKSEYTKPTLIQKHAILMIMGNRDLITVSITFSLV